MDLEITADFKDPHDYSSSGKRFTPHLFKGQDSLPMIASRPSFGRTVFISRTQAKPRPGKTKSEAPSAIAKRKAPTKKNNNNLLLIGAALFGLYKFYTAT